MKATFLFQLTLERVEPLAHKLSDLSAAQTGDMYVISAQLAFVVVAFTIQMHQVEFVNQSLDRKSVV